MKKNFKKIGISFLGILLIVLSIMCFKPKTVQAGGGSLTDLTNVTLNSDGVWSWDAFPGTFCYFVKIGTFEEFSVYETSFNLYERCRYWGLKSASYPIEVYAADSNSNALTYKTIDTYNYVAPYPQLATPTNIQMNGKKLTWNSVQYATGYILEAYNELDQMVRQDYTSDTYFDYNGINSFLIGNEYHIQITAIDESATLRPTSEIGYSEYFEGWFIKGYIENWNITRGVAEWKEITQANYYYVSFYDQYGSYLFTNSVSNNYANLYKMAKDEGLANGTYGLLVWAVDGDYVEITHKLEKTYTYEANKYCTVTFHLYNSYDYPENIVPGGYAYEPTNLRKLCHKMNGWYLNDNWMGYFNLDNNPIYGDMDLYGFWELIFTDLEPNSWYMSCVDFVYREGLIKGYSDPDHEGMFGPNDKITRAQIVTILYRMEGSPNNDGKSKFTDVNSSEWYAKAIKWAVDCGVVHGYDGTSKFGPNDNIIRQDLAGILRNYAKYKGKNVNVTADLTKFKDYKKVDSYANTAVQWAVGKGVITGNDDGTLNPKGNATRAEAAAMIQKYCNKVKE